MTVAQHEHVFFTISSMPYFDVIELYQVVGVRSEKSRDKSTRYVPLKSCFET